jgi:small subunit ribosomal protein S18
MQIKPVKVQRNRELHFSYKDVKNLRRFMSEQGYILPRSKTGTTQKQQKLLAKAVKHARHLALLPFTQTL